MIHKIGITIRCVKNGYIVGDPIYADLEGHADQYIFKCRDEAINHATDSLRKFLQNYIATPDSEEGK